MASHPDKPAILVVEGDAQARWTFQRLLEDERYDVATTDSGSEAIAICRSRRIDLAIIDGGLPGQESNALEAALQVEFPQLKLLLITGRRGVETTSSPAAGEPHLPTLPSPLSPTRLLEVVRALINSGHRPSP